MSDLHEGIRDCARGVCEGRPDGRGPVRVLRVEGGCSVIWKGRLLRGEAVVLERGGRMEGAGLRLVGVGGEG